MSTLPPEAQEHLARCATPAHLAMAVTADLSDDVRWKPARHLMYVNDLVTRACLSPVQEFIDLEVSVRHGKALALDTPVPTPTGWSTIGALAVGDEVFDEQGVPCRVVAKSPVWSDRPCFTVTTDDGDTIVSDGEHEWPVRLSDSYHNRAAEPDHCPLCDFSGQPRGVSTHMGRKHGVSPSVLADTGALRCHTAADLAARRSAHLAKGRSDRPKSMMSAVLKTDSPALPVDPWLLGFWLGDGTTIRGEVTIGREDQAEVVALIEHCGYRVSPRANPCAFGVLGLQVDLRSIGVLGNKHVPPSYARASATDRLALLQGLIDSDGHVSPKGQVEFCSTNRSLAESTQELVRSLGYKASLAVGRSTLDGRDCGPKYRVLFYMPDCARLSRKRQRCIEPKRRDRFLTVEPTEPTDTQCIEVDSPSHCFLAGRGMVPTHNSFLVSGFTAAWYIGMFPDRRVALLSYNSDKAAEWGEFTMDIIDRWGMDLFGIAVDPKKRARNLWGIKGRRGEVLSTGLGGTITGKGFDYVCLPGDAVVQTPDGPMEMAAVHASKVLPLVLSWSHEHNRAEWHRILTSTRRWSEELVEITTASGAILRCTPDHRVFDPERGYREAGSFRIGDSIIGTSTLQDVPEVRVPQEQTRGPVPGLLVRPPTPDRARALRSVWRGLLSAAARAGQGRSSRSAPRLLLHGMSGQVDGDQPQEAMPWVRCPAAEEHEDVVRCLQGAPTTSSRQVRAEAMPGVRGDVPDHEKQAGQLLTLLREHGALGADEGQGELALQGRDELLQVVQGDAPAHLRARRRLRGMPIFGLADRPPRRRGPGEQPARESADVVFDASHDPSSFGRDTVALVRHLRTGRIPVYDIGVEGTHNFFADGVLVHNCIDDPVKNREDADSTAERKKLRDGYYSNVRTRLAPHGTVVLAMARWREDDLAGEIVHGYSSADELEDAQGETDNWQVVRMPAIAEAPYDEPDPENWRDVLGRKEGEALWPEQWPIDLLTKIKNTALRNDPQMWYSLYQQNPTSKEGRMFKKGAWKILPHVMRQRLRLVRWWDLAATEDGGDWTVGALVGMDADGVTYVLDIQRFRKESSEVEKHIRLVAENDGIAVPVRLEQERAGAGKSVASTYKRLLTGFDVDAKRPETDKVTRANPYASQQQVGRVVLLEAPWNDEFIEEHRLFPKGRWDDQVDATSGAFGFLAIAGPTTIEVNTQMETPIAQMYGNARPKVAGDLVGASRARFRR